LKTILDDITDRVREDVPRLKKRMTLSDLESMEGFERPVRSFSSALKRKERQSPSQAVAVIAEVKKGSPSKGIFRPDRVFDPVTIAAQYMEAGAAAISVLTNEPFFFGSTDHLQAISRISEIPLLRKDFLIDPWQIAEARAYGADAVLLIEAILSPAQRNELIDAASELGLDVLLECYSEEEWAGLDWSRVQIAGVNNRDLRTFDVDLHRGVSLLESAPDGVIRVSESGLRDAQDLWTLYRHGIEAALIGEQLVRQNDPGKALHALLKELESFMASGM